MPCVLKACWGEKNTHHECDFSAQRGFARVSIIQEHCRGDERRSDAHEAAVVLELISYLHAPPKPWHVCCLLSWLCTRTLHQDCGVKEGGFLWRLLCHCLKFKEDGWFHSKWNNRSHLLYDCTTPISRMTDNKKLTVNIRCVTAEWT